MTEELGPAAGLHILFYPHQTTAVWTALPRLRPRVVPQEEAIPPAREAPCEATAGEIIRKSITLPDASCG
jgi:hypothetical protein